MYPRIKTSPETVQKYAEDLSIYPPIEINQRNELIDGWHRWTAHKKLNMPEIEVTVTETKNDAEIILLAIARNAKHGLCLSQGDKQKEARRIYHITPVKERDSKKKELAELLSVREKIFNSWSPTLGGFRQNWRKLYNPHPKHWKKHLYSPGKRQ